MQEEKESKKLAKRKERRLMLCYSRFISLTVVSPSVETAHPFCTTSLWTLSISLDDEDEEDDDSASMPTLTRSPLVPWAWARARAGGTAGGGRGSATTSMGEMASASNTTLLVGPICALRSLYSPSIHWKQKGRSQKKKERKKERKKVIHDNKYIHPLIHIYIVLLLS